MDQTSRTCSGAPPTLWTRFCAARSQAISGRAADQIRPRHQSDDRQGARPRNPASATRPRRRGDRVTLASASKLPGRGLARQCGMPNAADGASARRFAFVQFPQKLALVFSMAPCHHRGGKQRRPHSRSVCSWGRWFYFHRERTGLCDRSQTKLQTVRSLTVARPVSATL